MKKINIILIFVLFLSCSDKKNRVDIMFEQVMLFEECENTQYKNIRLNILRISKNTKQFEYKLRKKDIAGFAVFQTNPSIMIFKNIYSSPIDLAFVEDIRKFNRDKNIVLLLLENYNQYTKLEFKIKDEKIILLKGAHIISKYDSNQDSIQQLNQEWYYLIKPFIGER